jgi:A/G-specific adenine glycosylase
VSTEVALPAEKRAAVHRAVLTWYRRSHRDLPWRHTRDPYAILVSEVMLQQTQVDRVLPKFREWMERYPTLAALAAAPRAAAIRAWSGLGYNLRAVRLHEIARQAVERFGGQLPEKLEGLLSLKGIGRYTAAAVMCFAHGAREPVLDTNVRRVLGRIFAAEAPAAIEDDRVAWPLAAAALPPASDVYDWNQALMDIGATICLSRNPCCLLCPAQERCTARREWFAPDHPAVAERRAVYEARRPKQGKFEGSRRWYRGQIVAALRDAPDGVAVERLAERIALDVPAASEIVAALARDGLVEVEDGLARLPV